jgi:ribosomal protein S3
MAQKIPPQALRLEINRHYDAYWFSDRMYSMLLHQTLQTKAFLSNVFKSIGTQTALSHVQATPHAVFINSFVCSPRLMNKRLRKKKFGYSPTRSFAPLYNQYMGMRAKAQRNALYALCLTGHSHNWNVMRKGGSMHALLAHAHAVQDKHYEETSSHCTRSLYTLVQSRNAQVEKTVPGQKKHSQRLLPTLKKGRFKKRKYIQYKAHIESVLASYFQKRVVWTPHKMKSLFTSATFVANYIALQLEQNKKMTFRLVSGDVFHQCAKVHSVSGIRITCAGRLNGVEMARLSTASRGRTSLHVFDNTIDYHATAAYTRYGLIGIKVCMSFIS